MRFDEGFELLKPQLCPYQDRRDYNHLELTDRSRGGHAVLYYVSYLQGNTICCVMYSLDEDHTYFPSLGSLKQEKPQLFYSDMGDAHISNCWTPGNWRDCCFVPARIWALL